MFNCAMAMVLGLFALLCVCVSVCLSVCYHASHNRFHLLIQTKDHSTPGFCSTVIPPTALTVNIILAT